MDFWTFILCVIAVWVLMRVVRYIRKERYFASEEFLAHKNEISAFVAEHNEVGQYASGDSS